MRWKDIGRWRWRSGREPEPEAGWEPEPGWDPDPFYGGQRRRVKVGEVEAANMASTQQLGSDPVPFGFINDQWRALVGGMHAGDELWQFRSSPESWRRLAGREGYYVVRDGSMVDDIVTLMN